MSMKTNLTEEQMIAGIARNEATRGQIKSELAQRWADAEQKQQELKAEINAASRDAKYATLADVPVVKHATTDDDDGEDEDVVTGEPHYAGDDENLTSEELNR